jgi:hypothetical protein
MNNMTAPIFLTVMINVALVMTGFTVFGDGLLGYFVDTDPSGNVTGVSENYTNSLPTQDTGFSDSVGAGSFLSGIIDGVGVIVDFIIFVLNVAVAPIALIADTRLPNVVRFLIGLPLMFFSTFGVASFIRSGA